MLQAVVNAFKIADLRRKILFTLGILVIFRIVAHVPVPGVDFQALNRAFQNPGQFGDLFNVLNIFSGGTLQNFSVAAMGVYPYITASIIIQLLTGVIPRLTELSKLIGMARYALEGRDTGLLQETQQKMQRIVNDLCGPGVPKPAGTKALIQPALNARHGFLGEGLPILLVGRIGHLRGFEAVPRRTVDRDLAFTVEEARPKGNRRNMAFAGGPQAENEAQRTFGQFRLVRVWNDRGVKQGSGFQ